MVAKIHIETLVFATEDRSMKDPRKIDFTFIPIILVQFEFLNKKVKGRKRGEREERRVEKGRAEDWDPDAAISEFW